MTITTKFEGALVHTCCGAARGHDDQANTWAWKGIPYAAPPVGTLRWRAPRDAEPWQGEREFSAYGPLACQSAPNHGAGTSEDCLYLNVWRPRTLEADLPVYVWIHGGGNFVALPGNPASPGHELAARGNMVVVTFHYRLAELGWLTHPKMRTGKPEDALDDSGNYGTLDMIKALTWVRDNIASFGGDPGNVFLTGESAGGQNVFAMLASPLSKGLFHRAMAQSGGRGMVPRERAEKAASRFIRALLVADGLAPDPEAAKATLDGFSADALRTYLQSKSFSDMLRARKAVGVPPALIADGVVLPREGGACFDQGNYNKVPTILGMTRDESKMRLFLGRVYRRVDDATYTALAKLSTDMTRVSGCDSPLRAMSAHRDQPGLYGYQFVWGASPNDNPIPAPYDHRLGSYHALDIAFFFRVWSTLDINQLVFNEANLPGREALSDAIMDYMAQFARTGNPNRAGSGLPEWTAWSAESGGPKLLLLDGTANAADIAMNNEELSAESIRAWLADLPQSLRDAVLQASAAPQDSALGALP